MVDSPDRIPASREVNIYLVLSIATVDRGVHFA